MFVRNLANTVTEEILEKAFSQFGKLERVKKLKDYPFIHFDERDGAVKVSEEDCNCVCVVSSVVRSFMPLLT